MVKLIADVAPVGECFNMAKTQKPTKPTNAAAEWLPISSLETWVRNPRINNHKVAEMVGKILRFGWGAPIVAWRDAPSVSYPHPHNVTQPVGHRIGAGHLRRKGMLFLMEHSPDEVIAELAKSQIVLTPDVVTSLRASWSKDHGYQLPDAPAPGMVPVRFVPFTSEREYEAFAMMDNTKGGDWDEDELALLVAEHMRNFDENFVALGFDKALADDLGARGSAALDALLGNADGASGDGVDMVDVPTFEVPPQRQPASTSNTTTATATTKSNQPETTTEPAAATQPKLAGATIHYDVIFDTVEQQERWYVFIKALKATYPNEPTLGARLDKYLTAHPLA